MLLVLDSNDGRDFAQSRLWRLLLPYPRRAHIHCWVMSSESKTRTLITSGQVPYFTMLFSHLAPYYSCPLTRYLLSRYTHHLAAPPLL